MLTVFLMNCTGWEAVRWDVDLSSICHYVLSYIHIQYVLTYIPTLRYVEFPIGWVWALGGNSVIPGPSVDFANIFYKDGAHLFPTFCLNFTFTTACQCLGFFLNFYQYMTNILPTILTRRKGWDFSTGLRGLSCKIFQ